MDKEELLVIQNLVGAIETEQLRNIDNDVRDRIRVFARSPDHIIMPLHLNTPIHHICLSYRSILT